MTANLPKYLRFILRRERITSLCWLLAMTAGTAALAAAYPGLFPTKESLESMAATLGVPSMVAMMGPVYGLDRLTPAIAMAQECLIWFAVASIAMNIFFVIRHTRADEELGRLEMISALPTGRLTGGAAALISAALLNLAISLLSALALLALNIEGTTAAGAFCYTFAIGAEGFLFAALTLLSAQLFSTARGATGMSFALMGLFYILRAAGDMSGNALSYWSPMGLGLKVEAFYTDAFWPVALLFAEALAVAAAALLLNIKRDIGAGMIPAGKGQAHASRLLCSPSGLVFRLSKKGFIAWAAAFFILGMCYGSVVGELEGFVAGNDTIRQMLTAAGGGSATLVESFLPMMCGVMAMLAAIPAAGVVTRLKTEERRGRIEQIFACSVPRSAMFISSFLVAGCGAAVFIFLSAAGLYATSAATGLVSFGALMGAAFSFLPAVFVMAAGAALLVGMLPKLTALVWGLLGYSFLMMYFGRLFDVPEFAARLSPFENVPQLPAEPFEILPIAILLLIAAAFFALGLAGYRRRDIG